MADELADVVERQAEEDVHDDVRQLVVDAALRHEVV